MNKPYTKHKPPGVEWLGDVPEHWGVKAIKWTLLYSEAHLRDQLMTQFTLMMKVNMHG